MAQSSGALKVLILAGSAEARVFATIAVHLPGVEPILSYAGVTSEREPLGRVPPELVGELFRLIAASREPAPSRPPPRTAAELIASIKEPPPAPKRDRAEAAERIGGFGGAAGLAAWLRSEGVGAVVDATHPFAAQMQANAVEACAEAGVPRLRLLRPAWPVRPGWKVVPDLVAAAEALPAGAKVFLTTGRRIAPFAPRTDCRFWVRTLEPIDLPQHMEGIVGTPSTYKRAVLRLIRSIGPTHLVSKNSGGETLKLDIAEALGIAVIMVARPAPPPGPLVRTVPEALDWMRGVAAQWER